VNDVKSLFELALSDGIAPDRGHPADPAADLARGRRRLRRRRLAGLAGLAAAVLGGALVPLSLHSSAGLAASGPQATASRPATPATAVSSAPPSAPPSAPARRIALVAWEGTQPPGYRVSEMPKGWVVQGSDPYRLTIAPANARDKNPDSFLGKLVVMLQSADATSPPTGAPAPVNGRPGFFQVQDDTQMLTFKDAGGHWVVIQAPTSLGWDSSELVKFAGGVQVLVAAEPGRG
jgi:hypothetical protein